MKRPGTGLVIFTRHGVSDATRPRVKAMDILTLHWRVVYGSRAFFRHEWTFYPDVKLNWFRSIRWSCPTEGIGACAGEALRVNALFLFGSVAPCVGIDLG